MSTVVFREKALWDYLTMTLSLTIFLFSDRKVRILVMVYSIKSVI